MRQISEATLVRVEVYSTGNNWALQWEGGNKTFLGTKEQFAKFLQRIKAADDREDPRSYRSMRYVDIASEIQNGSDRVIWVYKHMIPKMNEATVLTLSQIDLKELEKNLISVLRNIFKTVRTENPILEDFIYWELPFYGELVYEALESEGKSFYANDPRDSKEVTYNIDIEKGDAKIDLEDWNGGITISITIGKLEESADLKDFYRGNRLDQKAVVSWINRIIQSEEFYNEVVKGEY
jgi:hypothetical protein